MVRADRPADGPRGLSPRTGKERKKIRAARPVAHGRSPGGPWRPMGRPRDVQAKASTTFVAAVVVSLASSSSGLALLELELELDDDEDELDDEPFAGTAAGSVFVSVPPAVLTGTGSRFFFVSASEKSLLVSVDSDPLSELPDSSSQTPLPDTDLAVPITT
jgi:hypothetical protein